MNALMLGNSLVSGGSGAIGRVNLDDAILSYHFDEGSGDDVINHGTLAPDGTVDAGAIAYEATGAVISVTAGTGSVPLQALTQATVFAAFKWEPADDGEYGLFATPANDFLLTVEMNPLVPKFRFGDTNCSASFSQLHDGNWHILEGVYDGAEIRLLLDGVTLQVTAAAGKECDMENLVLGAFNNGGGIFPGIHGYLTVFDTALSSGKRSSARRQIREIMEDRGATFPTPRQVVIVGDSIIASINTGMVTYTGQSYPHSRNMAVGGYDIADLVAQAPQVDAQLVSGIRNSLVVAIGRNSFGTGEQTTYLADLQAYVAARFAAGWADVYICTMLPSTAGGFNTWRNARNAEIRANTGSWHSGTVDIGADSIMGLDAAASDTNIYYDGTHLEPTGVGYARFAREIKAGLDFYTGVAVDIDDYSPGHYLHVINSTVTPRTNGVAVDTVEDLAGANDGTGQVSHKPTYTAAGFNGGPGITFAADQSLYHSYAVGAGQVMTSFHVVSANTQTGLRGIYASAGNNSNEMMILSRVSGSSNWGSFSSGGDQAATSDIQGDGALVLEIVRTGAGGSFYINGVADGTFTAALGQAQGHVGGLYGAGQGLSGTWGASLVIPSVLTPSERKRIRAQLADDFSITLP